MGHIFFFNRLLRRMNPVFTELYLRNIFDILILSYYFCVPSTKWNMYAEERELVNQTRQYYVRALASRRGTPKKLGKSARPASRNPIYDFE